MLLLLVVAVPATAHTLGFSFGGASSACLAIGKTGYRIAAAGERADMTVRLDPSATTADIRVTLSPNADEADLVIVDDGDTPRHCPAARTAMRTVAVDASSATPDLVVGIAGPSAPTDYRIFVRSRFIGAEAAAALFAAAQFAQRAPHRAIASRH